MFHCSLFFGGFVFWSPWVAQDLMSAAGAEDVSAALELDFIGDRVWQIQACSAKTGEGLQEGMEWLVGNCRKGWMQNGRLDLEYLRMDFWMKIDVSIDEDDLKGFSKWLYAIVMLENRWISWI